MKNPLNNGQILALEADKAGIPLRTVDDVTRELARDKARSKKGVRIDLTMARLMLRFGRLTPEARAYVENYAKEA